MLNKTFVLFVAIFLSFLLVFSACNEPSVTENKVSQNDNLSLEKSTEPFKPHGKIIGYNEVEVNGKMKEIPIYYDPADTNVIEPKALPCDYYSIYVNEFDHYEPKNGKILGIWDLKHYISAHDFYSVWGFREIMATALNGSDWNTAINAGFDPNEIVGKVRIISSTSWSLPVGSYKKFFIDEPYEGNPTSLNLDYMVQLAFYLDTHKNHAKLYISSWSNDQDDYYYYKSVLLSTSNTFMMCDKYDGRWFLGCGDDQTYVWDWFKDHYGSSRIKSHWISLYIDGEDGEFDLLFNKANSMGINELFLFADDNPDNSCHDGEILTQSKFSLFLSQFCNSAFQKGWLREFVKTYKYMYHCPEYFGDPCYCNEHDLGWELA